uniref:hypothetical protein n=1 Tax=Porphyridium aerugineum TaxID=2792 RepID=UPI001FCDB4DE|nr:hypothetical protein MW505_pgp059 [Porphyridium aerugineum]UNJ17938.1 hypothetical protein [Porphyridium aerugineum]
MEEPTSKLDKDNKNSFYETLISLTDKNKEIINIIQDADFNNIDILNSLLKFLEERKFSQNNFPNYIDGFIYSIIYNTNYDLLKTKFPEGIINYKTEKHLDYSDLEKLLIESRFQEADKLTQIKLIKLAGLDNRQWLYFTDIPKIPIKDLKTIDTLWRLYSFDKFGFSIQRSIWFKLNKDWDAFLDNIGWTLKNKTPCRYPIEFIWNTNGPKGHLPLFNQLRGSQSLSALFQHPAWDDK